MADQSPPNEPMETPPPYAQTAEQVGYYGVPPSRHGLLGVVSFIIALVMLVSMLAILGIAGYLETTTPGGMSEDAPITIVLALLCLFALVITLAGAVIALVGIVVERDRQRLFGALGLVLNVLVFGTGVGVLVVGVMVE